MSRVSPRAPDKAEWRVGPSARAQRLDRLDAGAREDQLWDRPVSPGLGRVTLRLPESSQAEGDGLASDLTHAQSLSDANTALVAAGPVARARRSAQATDGYKVLPGTPNIGRYGYSV